MQQIYYTDDHLFLATLKEKKKKVSDKNLSSEQ